MTRSRSLALALACLVPACTNFHVIEEGRAYRSAQPDADDLRAWVAEHGLRTIVQLRGVEPSPEANEVMVQGHVILVPIPMSARVYPSRAQLVQLWDTFQTAEYPLLIHCRAGADRTGLAAAIYVLQRTGDLERARQELSIAYLHTGFGTNRLDRVLEMYERWHGRMDFRRWAMTLYTPPEKYAAREPDDP